MSLCCNGLGQQLNEPVTLKTTVDGAQALKGSDPVGSPHLFKSTQV